MSTDYVRTMLLGPLDAHGTLEELKGGISRPEGDQDGEGARSHVQGETTGVVEQGKNQRACGRQSWDCQVGGEGHQFL